MEARIGQMYDAIVFGSGPAASAAAIRCCQSGFKVCVISGRSTPNIFGMEPSESIHPGVASLLDIIDAKGLINDHLRSRYSGVVSDGVFNSLGSDENGTWLGMHIDKAGFSKSLFELATRKGVEVIQENAVELLQQDCRVVGAQTSSGIVIYSRFIIDCSGRKGFAGKFLKFQQEFHSPHLVAWTGVSYEIRKSFHQNLQTSFFMDENHWCWMAPEQLDRCTWTKLSRKGLSDFLPPLALRPFKILSPIRVANVRWRIFRPVVKQGILLCGDAAAIVDPAAGQGIFMALLSGIAAAECISKCFAFPNLETFYLAEYDQWFYEHFRKKTALLNSYYRKKSNAFFD